MPPRDPHPRDPHPRASDGLGRWGEELAAAELVGAGYRLLARNWRCPLGEIDIVASSGRTLVVCEVKTRTSTAYGSPAQAVTPAKARRLRRLAAAWLADGDGRWDTIRFDVVAVVRPRTGPVVVEHLQGVL
jgi:putative endonuclease